MLIPTFSHCNVFSFLKRLFLSRGHEHNYNLEDWGCAKDVFLSQGHASHTRNIATILTWQYS
eukprot:851985-Amphidinium_carterae.2